MRASEITFPLEDLSEIAASVLKEYRASQTSMPP
jgi:hypothetical protein